MTLMMMENPRPRMKFRELQEKFNNPSSKAFNQLFSKNLEEKIKEDILTYGNEFTFQDYLRMKQNEDNSNLKTNNPREGSSISGNTINVENDEEIDNQEEMVEDEEEGEKKRLMNLILELIRKRKGIIN